MGFEVIGGMRLSIVDQIISNIHESVAEYKRKNAKDPEYLILSMEQQQAIKLRVSIGLDQVLVEYLGIPIIDKETVVMP